MTESRHEVATETTHKGRLIRVKPLTRKVTFEIEIDKIQATTERTHTIFGRRVTRSAKYGTCFGRKRAFLVDAAALLAALEVATEKEVR